ncbi:MAG: sugar ABC transporter permease [Oscillospiraceae bacterium]|nr:sugar ABC transporter permease [Oscillospiraceae bacterium]
MTVSEIGKTEMKSGVPKRKRFKKVREALCFSKYLLPSILGVSLFFFGPMAQIAVNSFQKSPTNPEFVGLQNYERVLTNQAFLQAGENTLRFSLMAVPLAVVLSLMLALLLNAKLPGRSIFRSMLLNPMMVPVASIVLIWQVLFSFTGSINTYLGYFGIDKIDWMKSDWSRIVILLLFLWKTLGYNMVLFLAALNNVPSELIDTSKIDGAGSVRRFFSISLVYLYPTVFFVGIMSLISSFKIFREVYLLTGDYPYSSLYMLQHFMNNAFRNLDYQKLCAGAIIMALVMILIVGILFLAEFKLGKEVEE